MSEMKEASKGSTRRETKPWGETLTWSANFHSIHGKIIRISKGMRTSLKYHTVKNEVFFLLKGSVIVTHGNSETPRSHHTDTKDQSYQRTQLASGDVFQVQSECPYRIEALEDSELIEIGDRSDDRAIILEDDFGRSR